MKIKKLHIQNYKSLVDLEIIEPNPFTVFAGPNGAGKSNIFEAISFFSFLDSTNKNSAALNAIELFGGIKEIKPFKTHINNPFLLSFSEERVFYSCSLDYRKLNQNNIIDSSPPIVNITGSIGFSESVDEESQYFFDFLSNFSRVFIGNRKLKKINITGPSKINEDASNLENVLSRIFDNNKNQENFLEWMQMFVPGLETLIIETSPLSGNKELLVKEANTSFLFSKKLISDGTQNILCLLAAVYQSEEPQFLCIEEPENGLNPYVIKTLVEFFRKQCEEKGHYIWLNTHSQTLVKNLRPEELILVDKVDGATQIKQFPKDYNLHGLELDEAWLSNALGGGVPW